MIRPRYETRADYEKMIQLGSRLARRLKCIPHFAPYEFQPEIDCALFRGSMHVGWIEFKARSYSYAELDAMKPRNGYMLAIQKWDSAFNCLQSGLPFGLVVQLSDGLYMATFRGKLPAVPSDKGGRTDRGDPKDIETCVFLPMQLFQKIAA